MSWFYYGVENMIINQWMGTPVCVSLNITELQLPIPDGCFAIDDSILQTTLGPIPEQFTTGIPLPPGVTLPTWSTRPIDERPTLEDALDQLVDAIANNPNSCLSGTGYCPESHPAKIDGAFLVETLNYEPANFVRNSWLLVVLSVGFRVLAYAVLAFRFRAANR